MNGSYNTRTHHLSFSWNYYKDNTRPAKWHSESGSETCKSIVIFKKPNLMYAPRGLMLGSALVFQANKNTFLGFWTEVLSMVVGGQSINKFSNRETKKDCGIVQSAKHLSVPDWNVINCNNNNTAQLGKRLRVQREKFHE